MLSNTERYRLLTSCYISHSQILKIIGSKDPNKATGIISAIIAKATREGKTLLYERGRVPAKMLAEYLDIDMDELFNNALKEKQLGI